MTEQLRVIVVDDEPLAREAIRNVLRRRHDVEIVAECGNGIEALAAIEAAAPDLVFLDVQMPGLDGLQVVHGLEMHPLPFIVFVTAHDEYAVRAFEVEALDYLLKPVDDDRLNQCVDRAARRLPADRLQVAERTRAAVDRIAPRPQQFLAAGAGGKVVVVQSEDIIMVQAADNYVRLHTSHGAPLLRETLKSLERRLDPERFVRVHRSCLVDARRIKEMRTLPSGDYELLLDDGLTVPMSRTYRDSVFSRLGGPPR